MNRAMRWVAIIGSVIGLLPAMNGQSVLGPNGWIRGSNITISANAWIANAYGRFSGDGSGLTNLASFSALLLSDTNAFADTLREYAKDRTNNNELVRVTTTGYTNDLMSKVGATNLSNTKQHGSQPLTNWSSEYVAANISDGQILVYVNDGQWTNKSPSDIGLLTGDYIDKNNGTGTNLSLYSVTGRVALKANTNISVSGVMLPWNPEKTRFWFVGDSLTAQTNGGGSAGNWPHWLTNMQQYRGIWNTNTATAGEGMSQITNVVNSIVSLKGAGTNDVMFVWFGANDHPYYSWERLWFTDGASNCFFNAKAAGFELLFINVLPRASLTAYQETNRFDYNKNIRFIPFADYLVDAAALFPNNEGSFYSDRIHLTTNASAFLAEHVDAVLRSGKRALYTPPRGGWQQEGTNFVLRSDIGELLATQYGSNQIYFETTVDTRAGLNVSGTPFVRLSGGELAYGTPNFSPLYVTHYSGSQGWGVNNNANNRTIIYAENANAVNNTLYLKAGFVGIRTNSPQQALHVHGHELVESNVYVMGQLAVGSTEPGSYKLHVTGSAYANSYAVASTEPVIYVVDSTASEEDYAIVVNTNSFHIVNYTDAATRPYDIKIDSDGNTLVQSIKYSTNALVASGGTDFLLNMNAGYNLHIASGNIVITNVANVDTNKVNNYTLLINDNGAERSVSVPAQWYTHDGSHTYYVSNAANIGVLSVSVYPGAATNAVFRLFNQ